MKLSMKLRHSLILAGSTLLAISSASAQSGTWLGTSTNWVNSAAWLNGIVASGSGNTANFTGVNITSNISMLLGGSVTIDDIIFTDATTSSHDLTIAGASTLTLAGTPSINVTQADRNLTISAILAGTSGFTKSGQGTLTLSGSNSITGNTVMSAGRLVLDYGTNNNRKLPTGSFSSSGGTIVLKGGSATENSTSFTTSNSAGTFFVRDTGTAKINLNGFTLTSNQSVVSFSDASMATTDRLNDATGILGAQFTVGDSWATSAASGTDINIVKYTGATTFDPASATTNATNYDLTGNVTLSASRGVNTLRIVGNGNNQVLSLGGNSTTFNLTTSNFTTAAGNTTVGGLLYAGGGNDNYTISTSGTGAGRLLIQNGNGQTQHVNVFKGTLTLDVIVGNGSSSFQKTGEGTLVINKATGYSGATRVYQGVLRLTGTGNLGSGAAGTATTIQNGAAIELANGISIGGNYTLSITGTGVTNGGALRNVATTTSSYAGAITLGTGGARINSDTGTLTLSGGVVTASGNNVTFGGAGNATVSLAAISGGGGLVKDGLGTTTLSFANSYTGATSVTGGALTVSGTGSIATSTGLSVSTVAQFNYLPTVASTTMTLAAASTLTLADRSTIGGTFGSTIGVLGAASVGSNVVNLNMSGSFVDGTPYTVLTAGSGLDTAANYRAINTNYTYALTVSGTSVAITPTAATAATSLFWLGGSSLGAGLWSATDGSAATPLTNWATDSTGATRSTVLPGAGTNLTFSATGAANQGTMTLDAPMSANSITVNGTAISPNEINAITLGAGSGHILTLGSTTSPGITVNDGSGVVTLNAPIRLGIAQSWTNNIATGGNQLVVGGAVNNAGFLLTLPGAGDTTLSGTVLGTGGLSKSGNGTVTLSNTNTYTGATTISAGTLSLTGSLAGTAIATNSTGILNQSAAGVISGASSFTQGSSGTSILSGANTYTGTTTISAGTLSLTGSLAGTAIATSSTGILNQSAAGVISGTSSFTQGSSGTSILSGANTYTGATTISAGTLALSGGNNRLLSTGTVAFTGASTFDIGSSSQTLAAVTVSDMPNFTSTINGSGGTLTINGASDLQWGPGASALTIVNGTSTVVNLNGLSNFVYDSSAKIFRVGYKLGTINSTGNTASSTVTLAASNTITAATLALGDITASNHGGSSTLRLGAANILNVDNISIGFNARSTATLDFNAASSAVTIRNTNGSSAVSTWNIGSINNPGTAGGTFTDAVNLSNGTIDALVTSMTIGSANPGSGTARGGTVNASFTMGASTGANLTVGTLTVGQFLGNTGSTVSGGAATMAANGTFTLNSSSGALSVTTLNLATNTTLTTGGTRTVSGTFNLTNGTLNATTVQKGDQTDGTATASVAFNWATGTIGNLSGNNLTWNDIPITLSSGTHTFDISGSNTATLNSTSVISGANFGITKIGTGTLNLSAANTYTGATNVDAGTLKLDANNVIPDASNVSIGTATLDADTRSDTAGTLDVTGTATINLGSGGTLVFANSSAVNSGTWAGTLNITVSGSLGATAIKFGSTSGGLTSGQLAKISVNNSGAGTYTLDANGYLVSSGYTVTYNGNGNTGGSVPVDSNTYATSATVTAAGNTGNLVKTSFSFTGWNTQSDGLGTHYNTAATFTMGPSNVTLFADWRTPYQAWLLTNSKTDSAANLREYSFGTPNTGALELNGAGTLIVNPGQAPIITTTVGSPFVKLTYARLKNSGCTFNARYSDGLVTWLASNDPSLIYDPAAPVGETVVVDGDMEIVSINFPVFRDTGSGLVKIEANFCQIAVSSN
jgi:fibronectin-binding autotransporter adhesin